MKLKNNKAQTGDFVLFIWTAIIFSLIAVMISLGIGYFYSSDADVRGIHSEILSNKISDCLIKDYYFSEDTLSKFDVLDECNLNRELFTENGNYYISINVLNSYGNNLEEIKLGNTDYDIYCGLEASKNSRNLPKCSFKEGILGFDKLTSEEYRFEVIFGSNNLGGIN